MPELSTKRVTTNCPKIMSFPTFLCIYATSNDVLGDRLKSVVVGFMTEMPSSDTNVPNSEYTVCESWDGPGQKAPSDQEVITIQCRSPLQAARFVVTVNLFQCVVL